MRIDRWPKFLDAAVLIAATGGLLYFFGRVRDVAYLTSLHIPPGQFSCSPQDYMVNGILTLVQVLFGIIGSLFYSTWRLLFTCFLSASISCVIVIIKRRLKTKQIGSKSLKFCIGFPALCVGFIAFIMGPIYIGDGQAKTAFNAQANIEIRIGNSMDIIRGSLLAARNGMCALLEEKSKKLILLNMADVKQIRVDIPDQDEIRKK